MRLWVWDTCSVKMADGAVHVVSILLCTGTISYWQAVVGTFSHDCKHLFNFAFFFLFCLFFNFFYSDPPQTRCFIYEASALQLDCIPSSTLCIFKHWLYVHINLGLLYLGEFTPLTHRLFMDFLLLSIRHVCVICLFSSFYFYLFRLK